MTKIKYKNFDKTKYSLFQKEEDISDKYESEVLERVEDIDGFYIEVETNPRFVKFTIGSVMNDITTDINSLATQKFIDGTLANHLLLEYKALGNSTYYFKDMYGASIVFTVLDEVYPKLKRIFPELRVQDERFGQCHDKSLDLIQLFEGDTVKLVTGLHGGRAKESRYLHTWIEFVQDGVEFAIDYTQNVLMPKDMYYYLEDSEPLTIIPRKTVIEDMAKYRKTFEKLGIGKKFYCLHRHDLVKELNGEVLVEDQPCEG